MRGVALNFFPLKTSQFSIKHYRLPYIEELRPNSGDEVAVLRHFKAIDGEFIPYWTLFQNTKDSTEVECQPFDNIYLTIEALRWALIQKCKNNLNPNQFNIIDGIRRYIEIVTESFTEGSRVITLEPYLLRSRNRFGFLADFRFHPEKEHIGTRKSLQLSLSLDKHGQRNLDYYADCHSQLASFVADFHKRIFPLEMLSGQMVEVESQLLELASDTLELKNYVVGAGVKSNSQFMGVKQSGPLRNIEEVDGTLLYFVYQRENLPLSRDLFRALRGDTFRTFPGMENMFNFPISSNNSKSVPISDFSEKEMQRILELVVTDSAGRKVVPIVLTPFSKHDQPSVNRAYWHLKHMFLSKGLPIQVIATKTVADRNELKWSTASIGLQIFAKAGGIPWKVQPRIDQCLIVGIGQAHRKINDHIERFFAYSVLSDSSGEFEEVCVLGDDQDSEKYIESFGTNLRNIFKKYSDRYSSFVVHTTFAIRRQELDSIAEVLREQKTKSESGEFVSLKFNDRNRFFGFSIGHNSLVPHESTVIRLSHNEFLIWFEGLQYGQATLRKAVGNPMHVKFTYPNEELSKNQQRAHLQDAINLSGANWRGF